MLKQNKYLNKICYFIICIYQLLQLPKQFFSMLNSVITTMDLKNEFYYRKLVYCWAMLLFPLHLSFIEH